MVCRRPVPSTWVTAGMRSRLSDCILKTLHMNGASSSASNHSGTTLLSIVGANGRNDSLRLILAFSISLMSDRLGSPRMERLPRARRPHSIRPWNHPTTMPCVSAATVREMPCDHAWNMVRLHRPRLPRSDCRRLRLPHTFEITSGCTTKVCRHSVHTKRQKHSCLLTIADRSIQWFF